MAAPKRAPVLLPGSPEVRGGKVQPLYVSRFRKVGDEGYHYSDVDAGAYGDGEGGEEESASGGDVGQREVTFVHRLGGLERRKKAKKNQRLSEVFFLKKGKEAQEKKGDPFFKRSIIIGGVWCFSGCVGKKKGKK